MPRLRPIASRIVAVVRRRSAGGRDCGTGGTSSVSRKGKVPHKMPWLCSQPSSPGPRTATAPTATLTAPAPRIRLQLLPPKPKELLSTRRTGWRRFAVAMSQWKAASGSVICRQPGTRSCSMHKAAMTASSAPEVPSVCPVQPLVELQAGPWPRTRNTALILGGVIGPGARAVKVHVVDGGCGQARRCQRLLHRPDCAQALRMRCRHVVRIGAGAEA